MNINFIKRKWKNVDDDIKYVRLFNENIDNYFKVYKVQEYKYNKIILNENFTFVKKRAFIITSNKIKYIVPYEWLISTSITNDEIWAKDYLNEVKKYRENNKN